MGMIIDDDYFEELPTLFSTDPADGPITPDGCSDANPCNSDGEPQFQFQQFGDCTDGDTEDYESHGAAVPLEQGDAIQCAKYCLSVNYTVSTFRNADGACWCQF